jgi:hypothetical protein
MSEDGEANTDAHVQISLTLTKNFNRNFRRKSLTRPLAQRLAMITILRKMWTAIEAHINWCREQREPRYTVDGAYEFAKNVINQIIYIKSEHEYEEWRTDIFDARTIILHRARAGTVAQLQARLPA